MYLLSKLFRLATICSLIFLVPLFSFAVNVKDFGAKGDGKTDDTYAINSAISVYCLSFNSLLILICRLPSARGAIFSCR